MYVCVYSYSKLSGDIGCVVVVIQKSGNGDRNMDMGMDMAHRIYKI